MRNPMSGRLTPKAAQSRSDIICWDKGWLLNERVDLRFLSADSNDPPLPVDGEGRRLTLPWLANKADGCIACRYQKFYPLPPVTRPTDRIGAENGADESFAESSSTENYMYRYSQWAPGTPRRLTSQRMKNRCVVASQPVVPGQQSRPGRSLSGVEADVWIDN